MSTEFIPLLQFKYTNYKGVTSIRKISPYKLWFGNTEFHTDDQWFIHGYDVDKCAERNFALRDVIRFL